MRWRHRQAHGSELVPSSVAVATPAFAHGQPARAAGAAQVAAAQADGLEGCGAAGGARGCQRRPTSSGAGAHVRRASPRPSPRPPGLMIASRMERSDWRGEGGWAQDSSNDDGPDTPFLAPFVDYVRNVLGCVFPTNPACADPRARAPSPCDRSVPATSSVSTVATSLLICGWLEPFGRSTLLRLVRVAAAVCRWQCFVCIPDDNFSFVSKVLSLFACFSCGGRWDRRDSLVLALAFPTLRGTSHSHRRRERRGRM